MAAGWRRPTDPRAAVERPTHGGQRGQLKAVRFSKKNGESELLEVLNALLHPVLRVSQELYMCSECRVVCPHCGQLAPVTDTRKLKRLRRSIAPQLLLSHHQMDHKAVRVTIKGIVTDVRRKRASYKVRMSLCWAASSDNVSAVRILCEANADPHIKASWGLKFWVKLRTFEAF